ncbi:MAG: hypothetical protein ACF8PN_00585 [Phycisphaerales bacterium]
MRNSKDYAPRLTSLLAQLRDEFDIPEPAELDPVAQLVSGFLMWESSSHKADTAFERLQSSVVDFNELRVCLPEEIVEIIGERYPRSRDRATRLRASLRDLYDREHRVSLERVLELSHRDARAYLESLDGMAPYVAAQVLLFSKGAHAIPVDDQLVRQLRNEEIIDPDASLEEVQTWLERQIKAVEARDAHLLLQGWVEESRTRRRPSGSTASRRRAASSRKTKPRSTRSKSSR